MPQKFLGFHGGLNTLLEDYQIQDHELSYVLNASFSKPGTIRTRPGFKRGNRTAAPGSVLGIYEFQKADGTRVLLAKVGTELRTLTVASDDSITVATSALKTGLEAGFKPFFATIGDKCIIFDKTKNYIYDGTNITELGRDAPDTAGITLTATTGGSLTSSSTYQYKFTYRSTSLGIESTLSGSLSVTLSATQNAVSVTFSAAVLAELDAVWDKIRVYRTTANGSSFLFDVDVTGSFTDTTADGGLGATAIDSGYIKPPGGRAGVEYLGRLWLVTETDPTLVYYSEAGLPDRWKAANVLRISQRTGDLPIGFVKTHGRLYAITERGLFLLVGDDPTAMSWIEYEGAQGGEAGRAAVVVGGLSYVFNARIGIYRFLGAGVERIGAKIRPTVLGLDLSKAKDEYVAEFDPSSEAVLFAVRQVASSRNDRVLAYHIRTGAWSIWDWNVSAMAQVHDGSGVLRLLFGDDDGYFNWVGDYDSDGSPGGTVSGTVEADDGTTLTDSSAAFSTTGDGLANLRLYAVKADGTKVGVSTITSNTATTITHSPWSGFAPSAGDRYFVGGIKLEFRTKNSDLDAPTNPKRLSWMTLVSPQQLTTDPLAVITYLDGSIDGAYQTITLNNNNDPEMSVTASGSGGYAKRLQIECQHVTNGAKLSLGGVFVRYEVVDQRP